MWYGVIENEITKSIQFHNGKYLSRINCKVLMKTHNYLQNVFVIIHIRISWIIKFLVNYISLNECYLK